MSQKNKKESAAKKGGPNPILLLLVVVLVGGGIWLTMDRDSKAPDTSEKEKSAKTSSVKKSVIETFNEALADADKVVGIGPSVSEIRTAGAEVIGVDKIEGLENLLEGTDVDAVIGALEKAGVKHLVIDPSIVKRNPIPKNTVKNRLALAHPAGRLTAKLMSQKLFYYELGDPPLELPEDAKKALTSIARDTFGGGNGTAPGGSPDIINKKGKWTMILTVRPVQLYHLSYHVLTADTLADAAQALGKRAREYYEQRKSFKTKFGPVDEALKTKLNVELEVVYDEGTFIGPKDKEFMWRIIEPGINGFKMSHEDRVQYQPPWYTMTSNWRLVSAMLERVVKQLRVKDKNYWKRPEVEIGRFRTVHWRERTPGGEIADLYRASSRVPTMKDVTRKNLIEALKGLNDWIADNQHKDNGEYTYRYYPNKDKESDEYNMVRHTLGPFSMALTQEFAPNPKYKIKAEAGMKFIEDHIRWGGKPRNGDGTIDESAETWMGKPLPGPDVALLEFAEPPSGDWSTKMGGVAVAILGYTQYRRVGWKLGPEREKVLNGLANFLLYMQNEEEGNFHHYFVGRKSHYYGTRNSIYPGEILYAVARLYGETRDERFREAFRKSFKANLEWFKGQMAQKLSDGTYEEKHRKNLVQFQPWMAMAMDEMYRYDPDPEYIEASNLVSNWILDTYQFDETRAFYPDYLGGYMKVLDEMPAMHTFVYTEGTSASFDLARRANVDEKEINKLRKGAMLSARFIMQMQARPGENDYYYLNPKRAKGGVRYCMNHNKQRIDYTYHALSSIYRILKAATDEDYAAVQNISMPKEW